MNRLLRWTARLGSVAVAGFVLLLWYHQPPHLTALPVRLLSQLGLLMLAVLGLLLGWRWERFGGALGLLGIGGFLLLEGLTNHRFPIVPPLFVMLLPGLLYLIVGSPRPVGPKIGV
jgi:hypothetical protein